ncbi:MAG: hypothetical protein AAGF32_03565 [Pseudomonadota bacterium]
MTLNEWLTEARAGDLACLSGGGPDDFFALLTVTASPTALCILDRPLHAAVQVHASEVASTAQHGPAARISAGSEPPGLADGPAGAAATTADPQSVAMPQNWELRISRGLLHDLRAAQSMRVVGPVFCAPAALAQEVEQQTTRLNGLTAAIGGYQISQGVVADAVRATVAAQIDELRVCLPAPVVVHDGNGVIADHLAPDTQIFESDLHGAGDGSGGGFGLGLGARIAELDAEPLSAPRGPGNGSKSQRAAPAQGPDEAALTALANWLIDTPDQLIFAALAGVPHDQACAVLSAWQADFNLLADTEDLLARLAGARCDALRAPLLVAA